MTEEKGTETDAGTNAGETTPYLGTWENKEAAESGLENLNSKIGEMGREKGDLVAQLNLAQTIIRDQQANQQTQAQNPESATDYDGQIVTLREEMGKLDPVDADYQGKMIDLSGKISGLSAMAQHEKTLAAATSMFKAEMEERDLKTTQNAFYGQNPDFQNPEMQTRIQERISADPTGMTDSLVAFREIQLENATTQLATASQQIAEMQQLLGLKKGADEAGTVITKNGQSVQTKTTNYNQTDEEIDEGMRQAIRGAA